MNSQRGIRPIILYLTIAFAVAWAAWISSPWLSRSISQTALLALVIAGSFGPFIAAGVAIGLDQGAGPALRFYARAFKWRMGWFVFLCALLLVPALAVIVTYLSAILTHTPFTLQMSWSDLVVSYLWLFVLGGPVGEEFGWSYLSDELDRHVPIIASTLVLGLIWGFWHLPLFYLNVPGLSQRFIPFGTFMVFAIVMRCLMSWAYHRSGRNLLSNLIFHNGVNLSLSIVPIVAPVVGDPQLRLWYLIGAAALAAVPLWVLLPPGVSKVPVATSASPKPD